MSEAIDGLGERRIYRTRRKRRRRLRIALAVLGAVIVVVVALAGGSYWWFSAKVHTANAKIDQPTERALATKPPTTLVSVPKSSDSTDILLIGNDTRDPTGQSEGSSDVMMLLHVDRDLDFLSLLSVTRDLYVDIPGNGKDRINAAYHLGGPALAITTIKQDLGVDVTKYIEINFQSFEKIIDSLGGVYVDVDRRYDKAPYWEIDLHPGYQLLDGANALLFARYRFDGNADFGRMARQQRILAAVRDEVTGWNSPLKLPGFVSNVMGSATTNLSANDMLKLAYWLAKLDGSRIKQSMIKGSGQMIDGKAVVVVDRPTLKEAVRAFLTPPGDDATGSDDTTTTESGSTTTETRPTGTAEADLLLASSGASNLLLAARGTAPAGPDAAMWESAQEGVPFALEAPSYIPDGFAYAYKMPEEDGTYGIKVGDGTEPAVRMGYRYQDADLYLGVSATTWTDAPIASPGTEVESTGVVYTMVGTSGKVDHIWWKKDGVLYFVSNTLMYTASGEDLLKMAESMTPVGGAVQ